MDDPAVARFLAKVEHGQVDVRIDDMVFRISDLQKSGFLGTRWTDGIVYYEFDANVTATNRTNWLNAAANWSAVADLTFVQRTTQSNYIHVFSGTGNWSYVGMIGGRQDMSIYNWSWEFIIAHEIGHALGLKHEHSRSDRGTYVVIHWENIADECGDGTESCDHNFTTSATTNYGTYDFDSVMHYGRCSFAIDPCPDNYTISAQPAYAAYNNSMGQRSHLSSLDEAGMAERYGPAGHVFSDDFETGGTGKWSTSLGETCAGEDCGSYTYSCEPANPNCTCYTTYSGGGVCAYAFMLCDGLTPCPGGVGCGAGQTCAITCCFSGAPVCIPSSCPTAKDIAPLPQPGIATTTSCRWGQSHFR